jgi:hypothetical protein
MEPRNSTSNINFEAARRRGRSSVQLRAQS